MTEAKPITMPLATSPTLTLHSGTILHDLFEYRTIVGSLQHIFLTWPDIAYNVNKLSQFMHQPTSDHWSAVKRLLYYLCGTIDHGIMFHHHSNLALHTLFYANSAGNKDDFTSISVYLAYLGRNPISWSSKKKCIVSRSSTKVEYHSIAAIIAEIWWICSLVNELVVDLPQQLVIYCDNVVATNICANPIFHSRMKHVVVDCYFICDQVQNGLLRVAYVSSVDQLANAFTKALPRQQFHLLKSKIGLSSQLFILRGHDKDSGPKWANQREFKMIYICNSNCNQL